MITLRGRGWRKRRRRKEAKEDEEETQATKATTATVSRSVLAPYLKKKDKRYISTQCIHLLFRFNKMILKRFHDLSNHNDFIHYRHASPVLAHIRLRTGTQPMTLPSCQKPGHLITLSLSPTSNFSDIFSLTRKKSTFCFLILKKMNIWVNIVFVITVAFLFPFNGLERKSSDIWLEFDIRHSLRFVRDCCILIS